METVTPTSFAAARRRRWARRLFGTSACLTAVALVGLAPGTPGASLPDVETACGAGRPYLAVACYRAVNHHPRGTGNYEDDAPAVALVSDLPDGGLHPVLATHRDVGAVWGLAYSRAEGAVYASAYLKRQLQFGRGGPGAIYRIDLASGAIRTAITVPNAGKDVHQRGRIGPDGEVSGSVGKSSLGGLVLSDEAHMLWVMNLADRRIYRYSLPGGEPFGSFAHGAAAEPWAVDARPFALMIYGGRLYHGVVNSAQRSGHIDALAAYVYESSLDGSNMREIVRADLTYPRGISSTAGWWGITCSEPDDGIWDWEWLPWDDTRQSIVPREDYCFSTTHPMPMLTDLAFDVGGDLVLGLRDRFADSGLRVGEFSLFSGRAPVGREALAYGGGAVLRARPAGDRWIAEPEPDFFSSLGPRAGNDAALGGLASVAGGLQLVIGSNPVLSDGDPGTIREGLVWFDIAGRRRVSYEHICGTTFSLPTATAPRSFAVARAQEEPTPQTSVFHGPATLGDVELLCTAPELPTWTPTAEPTATSTVVPTATPTAPPSASVTPSTPPPSATATQAPQPILLPILPHDAPCSPKLVHTDVALVIDASSSMEELTRAGRSKIAAARSAAIEFLRHLQLPGDQAAVVAFNSSAWRPQALTGDPITLANALAAIRTASGTRIDLGVRMAAEELTGPLHRSGNNRAMIVLTDGYNSPEPAESAIAAATAAKSQGIRLFTVGLGAAVDETTLRTMASQASDYLRAPDGEDLAAIYERIAVVIPCPPERFWPRQPGSQP
jgi:hypothetical protein